MSESYRIQEVNELIGQQLAQILTREISLRPGVFITVVKVDTSRDLRYSRVSVSIFPEQDRAYGLKTLQRELYRIQKALNKQLVMHPLPRIMFELDVTESQATEVEKIIETIHRDDQEKRT